VRGTVAGLSSPFPLAGGLPGVLLEDGALPRLLDAFDDVLAPVFATLDGLDSYFDPELAPPDFLAWLAGWLGLALDDAWSPRRAREVLAALPEVLRWRGTPGGVALAVRTFAGVDAEVTDSGGVSWSRGPNGIPPGSRGTRLVVRVPTGCDLRAVDAAVRAAKPAHVPHRVEVR
jgi:phage tail-like protein